MAVYGWCGAEGAWRLGATVGRLEMTALRGLQGGLRSEVGAGVPQGDFLMM